MKTRCLQLGIWILLGLFSFSVKGQTDFDAYSGLKSIGTLPKDFVSSTYEIVKAQQDRVSTESEDKFEQEALQNFYLESNYAVDELLRSGKVLYNDEVSTYVNAVADEILKDHPALRKKLRFYVVKSPIPNAFTNQRGVILVNLGLIARLETEAQLAFILCHEIAHYILKHNQDLYLESQNIEYGRGEYRKYSNYDRLLSRTAYSRQNEKEADVEGLALFLKTRYDYHQIEDVFLLLRDAGKPSMPLFIQAQIWPESFLNDSTMKAKIDQVPQPEEIVAESKKKRKSGTGFITGFEGEDEREEIEEDVEVTSESATESVVAAEEATENEAENTATTEEDQLSTHPAPLERKKIIEQAIADKGKGGNRALFLISAERFRETSMIARYELAELYLQNLAFYDGIYHTLMLLQNGETSPYLYRSLGKALYGFAKYKHERESFPVILDYEDSTPEGMLSLTERLELFDKDETLLLALDYNAALFQQEPNNAHLKRILIDLLIDLQDQQLAQEESEKKAQSDFFQARMTAISQDPTWTELWQAAEKERERLDRREAFFDSDEGKIEVRKWRKKIKKKGYQLGIDKIVVFDPIYLRIDNRQNKGIRYVASEQEQRNMHTLIRDAAEKLDLEVEVLDSKILGDNISAEYWNDMALISSWHKEKLNHEVNRIVGSQYGSVQQLIEKYGTPYFFHTGALSVRVKNPGKWLYGGLLIASVFGAPLGAYMILSPDEGSWVFGMLYDLLDESTEAVMFNEMNMKANPTVLGSNIYYELYQIKRPAK